MTESKLYFKFHRTTGFVRRPCFCRVVLLGALSCAKPAWGVRTRLLIRTWPGPAPVAPFLYIFTPKIQTWAQGGDEQLFNQPRPPVRASHGSGSFKQICRGVMQRNCWKFSPNSCGKIYPGFRSEDASLHLSMGISTAPFRDFFCHEGTFLSLSGGAFLWRHLWIKKESNHPVAVNIINVHVLGFLWEGTFQAMLRKELSHPSGGSQPPRSWKISLVTHSLCSFFESAVGCKTKSFFYRIFNFARVLKAVDPSQTSLDYSWNQGS